MSGPAAFDGFWLANIRRTSSSVVIKFQLQSFCEDSDILRFSTSSEKSYLSKRLKNRLRSSAYSAVGGREGGREGGEGGREGGRGGREGGEGREGRREGGMGRERAHEVNFGRVLRGSTFHQTFGNVMI